MMNEKNTRSLFRAEKPRAPRVVVGMLIGLAIGVLAGWYFEKPDSGIGPGMLIGMNVALCTGATVPLRGRIACGAVAAALPAALAAKLVLE